MLLESRGQGCYLAVFGRHDGSSKSSCWCLPKPESKVIPEVQVMNNRMMGFWYLEGIQRGETYFGWQETAFVVPDRLSFRISSKLVQLLASVNMEMCAWQVQFAKAYKKDQCALWKCKNICIILPRREFTHSLTNVEHVCTCVDPRAFAYTRIRPRIHSCAHTCIHNIPQCLFKKNEDQKTSFLYQQCTLVNKYEF